ncbi:unnamed protein product [Heligmosomoides polygyrus]|uniref:DNA_pol3_delta domain-containing protein n=1 Tax=Heligmosomoides polygyrus TaxID=6339 RepID=A0A183FK29_HELPZ|nr:unnamed protein product [Heligmosomoides polygyrus]
MTFFVFLEEDPWEPSGKLQERMMETLLAPVRAARWSRGRQVIQIEGRLAVFEMACVGGVRRHPAHVLGQC